MFLPDHKIIFIHIPKTAGNFIQSHLKSLSDDSLVATEHRDGVHRFEVIGPYTDEKHASLADYRRSMGEALFAQCRVMACVRHPVDRALSMYFSPHRWMRLNIWNRFKKSLRLNPGHAAYFHEAPSFEMESFREMVETMPSMHALLDGRTPDILVRFEYLKEDLARVFRDLGLDPPTGSRLNVSRVDPAEFRDDPQIREVVRFTHGIDFDFFGYQS